MINILPILHNLSFMLLFWTELLGKLGMTTASPPAPFFHPSASICQDAETGAGLALYCPSKYSWAALNYVKNTSSQRQKYDQDLWGYTGASSMSFASAPFHGEGRMAGSKPPVVSSPWKRTQLWERSCRVLVLLGCAEQASWGWERAHTDLNFSVGGKKIIFVALQPLGVYSVCSNKGSSAVQGTRIYSNALKRRCSSSQSRAALAEGFPALWHTNCPNGGSLALPCAPTPPAVPWRWRNWGECKKALECLSSIPRCSVALLHVLIVNSQHQLIIEKVDVLRAKFGIAEARKF